jgi:hypothetical protein
MAYRLGQYNKNNPAENSRFMTLKTDGQVRRQQAKSDEGITLTGKIFTNECIQTSLVSNTNYYFHGKIKRMSSPQEFYIKLITYKGESTALDGAEQYIKTISIGGGDVHDWVDVEFIFSPLTNNFDAILFELVRTVEDYREEPRYPIIIYEELSVINNLITGYHFIKGGLQSRPGLMMCVNGEEIRISRTGLYEVRENTVPITFFSVVNSAKEDTTILEDTIAAKNAAWDAATDKSTVGSACLFDRSKSRVIDNFILDYIHEVQD